MTPEWSEPVPGEPPEAAALRAAMRRNFEREEREKQEKAKPKERQPWDDGKSYPPLVAVGQSRTSWNGPPELPPEPESQQVEEVQPAEPYALSLEEFVAAKQESGEPLVGDETENLLPVGGLLLLVAKGGKGKTTFTVDAAFHLASGVEWLGLKIARPLRVLIIENEGPREPFRRKLETKRKVWPHEIRGGLFVKTVDWGAFTVANPEERLRLRSFVESEGIDLVVGDPLGTLGIGGVGSPADVAEFMSRLVQVGLRRDVAFWLLHHPRKEETDDELDEASGAWGGSPDTMLRLDVLPGERSRLSFPKIRWRSVGGLRRPWILAFDGDAESFTVVHEEEADEKDVHGLIVALLDDDVWRTTDEISRKSKGGIGVKKDTVAAVLKAEPDVFRSVSGEGAKALGRSLNATLWSLTRASGSDGSDSDPETQGNGSDPLTPTPQGVRGFRPDASEPVLKSDLTTEPNRSDEPEEIRDW